MKQRWNALFVGLLMLVGTLQAVPATGTCRTSPAWEKMLQIRGLNKTCDGKTFTEIDQVVMDAAVIQDTSGELWEQAKCFFKSEGYFVGKGMVQQSVIARALAEIEEKLGKTHQEHTETALVTGKLHWLEYLFDQPQINTVVHNLLGEIDNSIDITVAYRQPGFNPPDREWPPTCRTRKASEYGGHIDGFCPDFPSGTVSILIGVALTDQPTTDEGNFCVVPKSHHLISQMFTNHPDGFDHINKGIMVDELYPGYLDGSQFEAYQPLQLQAGDVVFAHPLTVHFGHDYHLGEKPRIMSFNRYQSVQHTKSHYKEHFYNPWSYFHGFEQIETL
eukprot:TRINITY_DN67129_c7_g2_i2.p1 TRINITY_DN67129_c7_g2~~TRINITY_DN67129_c7_g2_i2.p1  ORF type:complete len:332 (+),score=16.19 TRINITY_DN67129_c7_g2_i2:61-1056(+)